MNQLEKIEQQFGFKYPELYKCLYNDGMLDWKYEEAGPDWHSTYWEKFKANPPLLLLANGIEMLLFPNIIEEIEAFQDPEDYRAIKPEFQFVPFLANGGGDLYVFQFDKQCGEDVPITFVPHDDESATILAKNLQDFIFRQLLECVLNIDNHSRVADGDLKLNLSNMLKTHQQYLSPRQTAKISEVYKRDIFKHEHKYKTPLDGQFHGAERTEYFEGLISVEELENILRQEIGFEYLDYEFVYMG